MKIRTSFSLSEKALFELKELSKFDNRSMANTIEELIDKKYKKEFNKIKKRDSN